MSSRLLAAFLSASAVLAFSFPAAAIEAQAAAEALAAGLSGGTKAKVTFDSASEAGGNVVIQGLSIADTQGDGTVRFTETVIEAPTDGGAGIFASPRITFTGGTLSGESKGSVVSAVLTEVDVLDPGKVAGTAPAKGVLFHTAEARDILLSRNDKPGEMSVSRVFMEVGNVVDNIPRDSKGTIEDITIPPEFFAEAQFKPATIGYDKLVLDMTWDGSRDVAAKTLTVRDFTLSLQDGGDLSFQGTMGNMPEPTALNDADAPSQATAVKVHNIVLRYEESSLAGRVLDWLAGQQGISRADYANQISAALPFLLAAVNNPEFQKELSDAIEAFLKEPKSLTVRIEPEAPISGEEIMGILGTAPQTLPDRLNASVTANTTD